MALFFKGFCDTSSADIAHRLVDQKVDELLFSTYLDTFRENPSASEWNFNEASFRSFIEDTVNREYVLYKKPILFLQYQSNWVPLLVILEDMILVNPYCYKLDDSNLVMVIIDRVTTVFNLPVYLCDFYDLCKKIVESYGKQEQDSGVTMESQGSEIPSGDIHVSPLQQQESQ